MHHALKNHFIPHAGNNYKPHILHSKRAIFYSAFFVILKLIVVLFVLFLPAGVFTLPDVIADHYRAMIALTNSIRQGEGLPPLKVVQQLNSSAEAKAFDMAIYNYFGHDGPGGHTLDYFLGQVGYEYRSAGENLAMGFTDAASTMAAWGKSPSHYKNLVDPEYQEVGVGLSSGVYAGELTVFIVEHFGAPLKSTLVGEANPRRSTSTPIRRLALNSPHIPSQVRGIKVNHSTQVIIDRAASRVYWQENGGKILLTARLKLTGAVTTASVAIKNYVIPLTLVAPGQFVGQFTIPESPANFFRPIVLPVVDLTTAAGERIAGSLDWFNLPNGNTSVVDNYFQAKNNLGSLTSLFVISRSVYVGWLIFFSVALFLNMVLKIRRQHPHIILQTAGLLVLLVILIRF